MFESRKKVEKMNLVEKTLYNSLLLECAIDSIKKYGKNIQLASALLIREEIFIDYNKDEIIIPNSRNLCNMISLCDNLSSIVYSLEEINKNDNIYKETKELLVFVYNITEEMFDICYNQLMKEKEDA